MRLSLIGLALALIAGPALAQNAVPYRDSANRLQDSLGIMCVQSNGTVAPCSTGSGSATPTGTAGSPNAAVVTVQGITGGTAQNVNVTNAGFTDTVTGNVASAATDAGSPVKIGCVYNATTPTVATAQRVDCQANRNGALITLGVQLGTFVDASGTVTTAATSQTVFAANANRVYLYCQNPVNATETLFVNLGAAAATTGGSFELGVGGSMTFASNVIPTTTVTVTAATAGHRFVCKQG